MVTTEEFHRYSIAIFDWEKALTFAKAALTHRPNTTVYEALLFAAIVCYYRPFSQSEKGKNPPAVSQLRIEDLPPLSQGEQELHANCKELRNKALAHSEFAFNPTKLNEETGVISSRPFSLLSQPFDLEAFVKLVSKLELALHHRRADHVREWQL